jgi:hypothetical protein
MLALRRWWQQHFQQTLRHRGRCDKTGPLWQHVGSWIAFRQVNSWLLETRVVVLGCCEAQTATFLLHITSHRKEPKPLDFCYFFLFEEVPLRALPCCP